MGDWGLEDAILRKNIPGRYNTHWDKDEDELNPREDSVNGDSDAEESEDDPEPEPEMPKGRDNPLQYGEAPGARNKAGAKATVAQYKYFKKMQYHERMLLKQDRENKLMAVATGATRGADEDVVEDVVAAVEDDSDVDDDFLAQYRATRLQELAVKAARPNLFGELRRDATKVEFVQFVEAESMTVVHLYQHNLQRCAKLNALLELLARRRPDIQFVSMNLHEAGQNFDEVLLPILACYTEGEVIDTHFQVTENLGDEELDSLEQVIQRTHDKNFATGRDDDAQKAHFNQMPRPPPRLPIALYDAMD